MLFFISIVLGVLTQALLFVGWPVPWGKLRFSLFRVGVLAFINEQSLWLVTLIYWYLIWQHSLLSFDLLAPWILVGISLIASGFVFMAAFTTMSLPKWVRIFFYIWYLSLDLYISLVFLIRSPSNIFINLSSKTFIDYYFFGMVSMHLVALVDCMLNYQHNFHLELRYKDRQVSIFYPIATSIVAIIMLLIFPRLFPITDFAFVGSLLAIGTWMTGQRMGNQKVGMKPKIT